MKMTQYKPESMDAMTPPELQKNLVRALMVLAVCSGCIISITMFATGWHVYRMHDIQVSVEKLDGSVQWSESVFTVAAEPGNRVRLKKLAKVWHRILPSITAVSLTDRELNDDDLQVLAKLTSVRHLELRSDHASDKVLSLISQLPRLNYLLIGGQGFSVEGMLKLRESRALERVEFTELAMTPIEMAVLETEIHGLAQWQPKPKVAQVPDSGPQTVAVTVELAAPALM